MVYNLQKKRSVRLNFNIKKITLSTDLYALFMQLERLAKSGDYDLATLRRIHIAPGVIGNKTLSYYLASLYLHLGEEGQASDLLVSCGRAGREMKQYCRVLMFCQRNQLPTPSLTVAEQGCLEYLNRVLNPALLTIDHLIGQHGGFSIVGNAPGAQTVRGNPASCKLYFNNYLKNPRIPDIATVHVVTPSWQIDASIPSECLCITGNDIFYRRSRVWRKFIKYQQFKAVYTLPQVLWSDLVVQLGGFSPSAGLLLLSYLSQQISLNQSMSKVNGYVAGFSSGQTKINHSYDSEPASDSHNWAVESDLFQRVVDSLNAQCIHFVNEP